MAKRIIVALIAIPIVLIPIYIGGIWGVLLLVTIAVLAGFEFYDMMEQGGYRPARWLGLIWLVALALNGWNEEMMRDVRGEAPSWLNTLTLNGWTPPNIPLSYVLAIGLIATITYALFQQERPLDTWFSTAMGAIYLGIILGQAVTLRLRPNGFWWLLFALLITWANDSAAYFVGVTIGKHKLWPRLSPKKSWEGTIGGWVGAALAAMLLTWLMPITLPPLYAALVGLVAGMLALVGDLSISMLKRQVGVKDSGWLFPGHGGLLDRLDSILFVIPFVYMVVSNFSIR